MCVCVYKQGLQLIVQFCFLFFDGSSFLRKLNMWPILEQKPQNELQQQDKEAGKYWNVEQNCGKAEKMV